MSQQKLFFEENIKVIPQNYVVFECQDDEPMGQIRINLLPNRSKQKEFIQFQFQLMVTNKNNYKVSNAKGIISNDKKTALIRIYMKNTQNLQKCLSDKFRLRIADTMNKRHCIDYKFKVLIEKQVINSKSDDLNANSTQTISKPGISIYTNPSILTSTASSDLKSIFYLGQSIMKQQHKTHNSTLNFSQLIFTKQSFDDSTHNLSKKKKQLQIVQQAFGKKKTREKFCVFLIFFLFFASVLTGFCAKKLTNKEMWTHFIEQHFSNFQYF